MSNPIDPEPSSDPIDSQPAASGNEKKRSKSLYVLLPILVLALLGLFADRRARAKVDEAEMLLEQAHVKQQQLTSEKVQELLGRKPDKEMDFQGSTPVEKYSWRSGLPWRKFFISVAYSLEEPHVYEKSFKNLDIDNLGSVVGE